MGLPLRAQDFKTAHLLGICPRAQFFAMALGSAASVFVSVGAYSLYTSAWSVPSATFPAPTAQIWLDMAQLVRPVPRALLACPACRVPAHAVPISQRNQLLHCFVPIRRAQLGLRA
jgi:hypothetical protein